MTVLDFSINTTFLDANAALKAYNDYKQGRYSEAINGLLSVLDTETRNWQARLFLGVCYYKTGQKFGAVRAFRYVYENCDDAELKSKACVAMQSVKSELEAAADGGHLQRPPTLDKIFSIQ